MVLIARGASNFMSDRCGPEYFTIILPIVMDHTCAQKTIVDLQSKPGYPTAVRWV